MHTSALIPSHLLHSHKVRLAAPIPLRIVALRPQELEKAAKSHHDQGQQLRQLQEQCAEKDKAAALLEVCI